MKHESTQLPHGYTLEIHADESPANPFTDWDCEPPIAVWTLDNRRGNLENYGGDELNLETLISAIPDATWESRQGKREILNAVGLDAFDIAQDLNYHRDSFRDRVESAASEIEPSGWRCAVEYFDRMEAVARLAGIPCHLTQSNGCSQGDCALVFVAALPQWVEKVGAAPETLADQCKAACDLWSAWAWGDVFGFVVNDPKGEEVDSCWGYYGDDHRKSGLLETAEESAKHHRESRKAELLKRRAAAKVERREAFFAACRDIVTA
jgi:hypothetical protein